MVQYPGLDRTLAAVAHPTRRGILERLGHGPATISELAEPHGISLTGIKKHVRILEEVQLVTSEKKGRVRECRLGPQRLDAATQWIEMYRGRWERRLLGLEAAVEQRANRPG
jgi:DNA-binding transcriptional ArsR family regulator